MIIFDKIAGLKFHLKNINSPDSYQLANFSLTPIPLRKGEGVSQRNNSSLGYFNSIGLVPTMGALHEGHISLIKASKAENDLTVCTIFVNPIQFNNATDLEKYPKTIEADIQLLQSVNCDILFMPNATEMYPHKTELVMDFGYQNTVMEGKFRPGHFSGVGIVVAKLFNIVQPERAYFGQKDFQQCLIIKQLVRELSFPIDIRIIETLRESDGLAMSSRNARLGVKARESAPKLYEALLYCAANSGNFSIVEVKEKAAEMLHADEMIDLEYIEFVDFESGKIALELIKGEKYGICLAANVGDVRLIDNIIFNA